MLVPVRALQEFAGKMRRGADAGGREAELAGIRLRERDQLRDRIRRAVFGLTTSTSGTAASLRHRHEILDRVGRHRREQARIDDVDRGVDEDRVAVRRGLRDLLLPDHAARARDDFRSQRAGRRAPRAAFQRRGREYRSARPPRTG